MSKFQIRDEGVDALWAGLLRELDVLAPSESTRERLFRLALRQIERMRLDGSEGILEAVPSPATRTGNHVLRLRFSRAFYRNLASAAEDRGLLVRH